ncbi:MAG: TlyA family RNA methyltransferase [Bacillota bacterium]|nr:TlyA family RNA methyltransferase [Bacillota bacterium]NLV62994.1 TlyA family RNA methyltransferase [Clostridiaceae bacterium]
MPKERLDILLVKSGCFDSREQARRAIMAGLVCVNGELEDKPGSRFETDSEISVKANPVPYVGRGGLKLEKALKEFNICLKDMVCMDIGASTGGFTDCMLQNGAKKVYSIDVGYGQLAWKLRTDERVVVMERTNFRYVKPEDIGEPVDFASADVSFISLEKIIAPAKEILKPEGSMVCLIKPQFEAGREKVGKKGVVRDPDIHCEVIDKVVRYSEGQGFFVSGLTFSPIRGPEGNIEYLLYIKKEFFGEGYTPIRQIVTEAHAFFESSSNT